MDATIQFNYAIGDKVEVKNDQGGGWHSAIVMQMKPYRGRPGYYVQNVPLPRSPSEGSAGGWVYEAIMRRAEV